MTQGERPEVQGPRPLSDLLDEWLAVAHPEAVQMLTQMIRMLHARDVPAPLDDTHENIDPHGIG